MAVTEGGLWYPDDGTPMDIKGIIWTAQKSVEVLVAKDRPVGGIATVNVSGGTGTAVVMFPAGHFSAQPFVTVSALGGTPFHPQINATNGTTGFTGQMTQIGASTYSGTRQFMWNAVLS